MSTFTTPLKYVDTGKTYHGNPVYAVLEEFDYCLGSLDAPIATFKIPAGFETDLATIPFPINRVFHPDGPWAKAAVLHDWLCNQGPMMSNVVKDSIFLEAMEVLGVNRVVSMTFFFAVRLFHWFRPDQVHPIYK